MYIMALRSLYITMIMISLITPPPLRGQIRSLQGILGGEFEQYDFTEFGDRRINSYFRQLASLSLQGSVYNHNLADFTLQTRVLNTNSSLRSGTSHTKEHNLFLNFYDLSVILLKKTKLPLSFYLRRDLQANETNGTIPAALSNRILTTAGGGRLSYAFNNGFLPTMTLGYNRYNSESVTPGFRFAQQNVDYEIGLFQSIGRTTLSINGLQSERRDRVAEVRQTLREARFQQHTALGETDQLLSNGAWQGIGDLNRFTGTSIWNARFSPATRNQATLTYNWLQSSGYSNLDVGMRNQTDVEIAAEWRAMFSASLSQGRTRSRNTT